VLEAVAQAKPESFFTSNSFRLPQLVREAGHKVAVARDVLIQYLWPPRDRGDLLIRVGLQRNTNIQWQELRRQIGEAPTGALWKGNLIKPQTELATVIIVCSDAGDALRRCIPLLYEQTLHPFDLILIDNGADDSTADFLDATASKHDNVQLIRNPQNLGYSYGCNQGLAAAAGEFLVLLAPDALVTPNWLSNQIALLAASTKLGAVGPSNEASFTPDTDAPTDSGWPEAAELRHAAQKLAITHDLQFSYGDPLVGPCIVLRRSVVAKIGGLDTQLSTEFLARQDLSARIVRGGYRLVTAQDVLIGGESATTALEDGRAPSALDANDWEFFCSKWNVSAPPNQRVPLNDLVASRPFEPAFDRIPTDANEVFRAGLRPIEVEGRKPKMLLMIPEWDGEDWKQPFGEAVQGLGPDDPVGLLLRVEPPTVARVEYAVQRVGALLAELGISEEQTPDMLLDTTLLHPADRGRLYAAATALIATGGSRGALYEHEAMACGLPVLRAGDSLRSMVKGLLAGR
jgi:hypothetical protein